MNWVKEIYIESESAITVTSKNFNDFSRNFQNKIIYSNLERDLEVLPRAASALPNTVELTVNLVGKILSMIDGRGPL